MADKKEQEPSIEEILSSIRQIISDDDEDIADLDDVDTEEEIEEEADIDLPSDEADEDSDILELTDIVGKPEEAADDLEQPEPEEGLEEEPEIEPVSIDLAEADEDLEEQVLEEAESILTEQAAAATFKGFAKLTSHMPLDRKGTGSVTLEDIVRELLRPMLREWMDVNLPPLIEKLVQKELDKITRQTIDD